FGPTDAVEHAMGGRFEVAASDVLCTRHANSALDESDPLFLIPTNECSVVIAGARREIKDAKPTGVILRKAREAAGPPAESAMGKTRVGSPHVTCSKGHGPAVRCTLAVE